MNIVIFNAYYTPEVAASMFLEEDIAEGFARADNQVTMYVPVPCRGISDEVRNEYKDKKDEYQYNGRLHIVRYNLMKESKNVILRALRYFLQNFKQYRKGVTSKNVDVIFSGSTPPTQGLMCAIVKKRLSRKYKRDIKFIYNLQDVFPDSLVSAGLAKKGSLLWKIGRKIEDATYNNADKIIVISESFKKNIMEKGVPEEKIVVVSNWIDINSVNPVPKDENKLYDEFNINKECFLVVYAGNFGAAQGAEIVIEAAELLKGNRDIHFVVFGGGSGFEQVKKTVYEKELKNITISELMPPDRISEVYSLGDVAIITCKPGVGASGMPSKTWSIMACNTPIIASFDVGSELGGILKEAKCGICIEPGDATKLAEEIVGFYKSRLDLDKANGRNYVRRYASKENCVAEYVKTVKLVANDPDKSIEVNACESFTS